MRIKLLISEKKEMLLSLVAVVYFVMYIMENFIAMFNYDKNVHGGKTLIIIRIGVWGNYCMNGLILSAEMCGKIQAQFSNFLQSASVFVITY